MAKTFSASEFPTATRAQWRALVDEDLRQAAGDGLWIEALYENAVNAAALPLRENADPWVVAQRVDHPDAAAANSLALDDLENGASGLVLVGPDTRGHGLNFWRPRILSEALRGVRLDCIALRLDAGAAAIPAANAMSDFMNGCETLDVDFGIDPVGVLARTGVMDIAALDSAATLAKRWPGSRAVLGDGRSVHETGASPVHELAHVLATGLFYLRALETRGMALEAARRSLAFLLTADAEIYLTLAKFRALRFLWARIEEACGLAALPIRLHAETGWRMMTSHEPHLNMVRTAMAAFAAGLGGADSITILPFSLPVELPDALARRMARNAQIILQAEAHLCRVADPAAGAGAFESLTQEMCVMAWKKFQAIEAAGGIVAVLSGGNRHGGKMTASRRDGAFA